MYKLKRKMKTANKHGNGDVVGVAMKGEASVEPMHKLYYKMDMLRGYDK